MALNSAGEPTYDIVQPSAWDFLEASPERPLTDAGLNICLKHACRACRSLRRSQETPQLLHEAGAADVVVYGVGTPPSHLATHALFGLFCRQGDF